MTQVTQIIKQPKVLGAAIVLVLVAVTLLVLLPPAAQVTPPFTGGPPTARGGYHIHSDRSDGSGSIDDIARAAQRAGLQFIIITDHGDGTRPPDAPQYRHGVLVIDAVELNTTGGHLVAMGLGTAPYPLAGTAADVLEDVRRLGGFGVAAHPDSPRPALRWQAWDVAVDGLEWLNADSGWRDEGSKALAQAVLGYWFRAPGAMAGLLDRPTELLARWDTQGLSHSVTALAGADAHARLGFRQTDDPDPSGLHVPLPGYEATFRTFSNHVVLDQPLRGDGIADAGAVLAALKQGRSFTVIDALATPGALDFTAESEGRTVGRIGDLVALDGAVTLRARISGPPGTALRLLRNGLLVQETLQSEVSASAEAGVYRIEALTAGAPGTPPVPWLLSNPIYVGLTRASVTVGDDVLSSRLPARTSEATTEHGTGDTSELVDAQVEDARARLLAGDPPIGWKFALAGGVAAGQFAAIQLPVTGGLDAYARVRFSITSAAPMRAWVQLRAGQATERWGRTFYADGESRIIDLPLRSLLPIGATSTAAPPLDQVDAILFVVDTLNSRPGASGSMTISEVVLVR